MMLAMFAGEHRDDWDDLLPAVMMAYRSSGFSRCCLMFGEECPLPMYVGLPRHMHGMPDPINNCMPCGSERLWRWLMILFVVIRARQSRDKNDFLINRPLNVCLLWGIGLYGTTPQLRSSNWIHHGWDPIWLFLLRGGWLEFNCTRILQFYSFTVKT